MQKPAHVLLVGCGRMGGALVRGWLAAEAVSRVDVVDPQAAAFDDSTLIHIYGDSAQVPLDALPDVVLFAVKPQAMAAVAPSYARFAGPDTLFLSIAAGQTTSVLAGHLGGGARPIIRAMPNTPAAIGRGISVAYATPSVSPVLKERAARLLGAVGAVAWVEHEALLDPVTALSGSGPAYVFLLIETLAQAGVVAGLPPALAMQLAHATVTGSAELARRSPEPAAILRAQVTSPGGTTEAALAILTATDGIQPLFDRALRAAADRARILAGEVP